MEVTAKWIWFPDGPKENRTLAFAGNRISDVNARRSSRTIDLGDVCLLPSLVNAHTHLEFSDLDHPIGAANGFADWIGSVVRHRLQLQQQIGLGKSPEDAAEGWKEHRRIAWQKGVQQSSQHGVGALVDMVTQPWDPLWFEDEKDASNLRDPLRGPHLAKPPICLFALAELLGTTHERYQQSMDITNRWGTGLSDSVPSTVEGERFQNQLHFGFSPHAPYTTPIELMHQAVSKAQQANRLISVHLGESLEELEWIGHRRGPLRDMLDRFAPEFVDRSDEPRKLITYLEVLSLARRSLIAHGNYLDGDSVSYIANHRERMAIVYCPRTHQAFGHAPHPWQAYRDMGIPVFLGTDSCASNPDLNLLEEARAIYRQTAVPPSILIDMMSSEPARFLGIDDRWGRIDIGAVGWGPAIACSTDHAKDVGEWILNASPTDAIAED